jgi:hypothetical protein
MGLNSSAGGFDIYQYFMAVPFEAGGHVPARLLNSHDAIVSKHACATTGSAGGNQAEEQNDNRHALAAA